MGWMYARFVAVSVALLGGVMFFNNLADKGFSRWEWIWIIASGLAGFVGGVSYLLTIDGPERFRQRWIRAAAWSAMLSSVLLPTSLTFMLVPLTLVLAPTLFLGWPKPGADDESAVTSG